MAIKLSDFEAGNRPKGDARAAIAAASEHLSHLHALAIAHDVSAIIVVEGWAASVNDGLLRGLAMALNPCASRFSGPDDSNKGSHFLKSFWQKLPDGGQIRIFSDSWYGRVLDAPTNDPGLARAFDEINEFEALLGDHGTVLIKLFLHASEGTQRVRLSEMLENPDQTIQQEELDELVWRNRRIEGAERMILLSDTHWAPWAVIDANHPDMALLEVLTVIADRLSMKLPSDFPQRDPRLDEQARALLELPELTDSE